MAGSKVIEYLAIPRHAGEFTIPSIEFTYFDLKTQSYKTLKSEPYNLHVAKCEGNAEQVIANFTNKEDLKVLGKDIRYIKTGHTKFTPKDEFFYGTMSYYLWYIIPLICFISFLLI